MKQKLFLLLLLFANLSLQAQLTDTFEDGDFDNNPTWSGDNTSFEVITEVLNLNAPAAGTAYLSTSVNIANSTTWSFWLQLDFNPSASGNFPKIYLSADNGDLTAPLNGYFLRIGESLANDAFELYRQDGMDEIFLLRFSTEGQMGASSNNVARVQITRDDSGLWSCFADYSGSSCYEAEGTITDNTYTAGSHFGFFCQFTSSNTDNFSFDDVFIDVPEPAMELENLSAVAVTDLQLLFSKEVDMASATTVGNYTVENSGGTSIGNPVSATIDGTNPALVHLDISNLSINGGETYSVVVDNVLDCAGNSIGSNNSLTFQLLEPAQPFDILINEIFAAPNAGIGSLPEAEYIELYNRSNATVNLNGFIISDASSEETLSDFVLEAGAYVILCGTSDVDLFTPFGDVLGVSGFPSLNNSGDDLTLKDNQGSILHEVFYTTAWYQDTEKDNGGWSLELINPSLYCQGASNWIASNASIGGTPGTENSVLNNVPDAQGPKLLGATPIGNNQVRLTFDEIVTGTLTSDLFQTPGDLGAVVNVLLEEPNKNSILLEFSAPLFQDQTTYSISLQPEFTDCSGNAIDADFNTASFTYFVAEAAEPYDILINEIFADPTPAIGLPEAEYIELFNRSDKNINLEDFILADRSDEILLPNYLLQAGSYVILYEIGEGNFVPFGNELPLDDFVGLGNTEDDLLLSNPNGDIIHAVNYSSSWYQDSGKSDGGWSLEMINPGNYCQIENNWRASVNPVGGTPGATNSVLEQEPDDTPLDLICAYPQTPSRIELFFNKSVDVNVLLDAFNMEGFTIENLEIAPPLFNTATIEISPAMQADEIYTLSVNILLEDCRGNSVGMFNETRVALPQGIDTNDIVINEILFNPETGGSDFIELYNRSNKVLDISNYFIANRDDRDSIDSPEGIPATCLLFPDDYIVLTDDPLDIQSKYNNTSFYNFIEMSLPTFEDKEGTAVLYVPVFTTAFVIDEFAYNESLHYPLLSNKNGVSLERINPEEPTQSNNNWHSAAEAVGFATPTYQNSQFIGNASTESDDNLWLETDRLSPDNDGFEDFLQIQYDLDRPGFTANINIYDAKGRLIKVLTQNELLLAEGNIKWDGINDDGNRARVGVHILEAKLLHPDGEVKQYRLSFVLAEQL
ncbi:MAG: lamin tail domain-containing protein [Saprospiraceae bacterium]